MMCKVPDRWLDYSRFGETIDYTGILACKTPLKTDFHKCKERPDGIPPDKEFTPTQLVEYCKQKGQRIGLVVDLTNKNKKYYDPKEFESLGIKYAKVRCPGKTIPRNIYPGFATILKDHLALDDSGVIVVHCTRGVNRTGYLVCRFLMDHFNYSADTALEAFNIARGHSMDHEDYITNIHAYWRHSQLQKGVSATKKLDKATASKSQQSKLCSSKSSPQPQLCDDYDQCLDYVSDDDDDDDDDDDEDKNSRYKSKKSKESQNQWYDECDKPPIHKQRDKYAEADWEFYKNWDYYDH